MRESCNKDVVMLERREMGAGSGAPTETPKYIFVDMMQRYGRIISKNGIKYTLKFNQPRWELIGTI